MEETLITFNQLDKEEEDKKKLSKDNVNVTAPENIRKQPTDEDLKISQNLIDEKEEFVQEDYSIASEDLSEKSEVDSGEKLYSDIETTLIAESEANSKKNLLRELGFTDNEIKQAMQNKKDKINFEQNNELQNLYKELGINSDEIFDITRKRVGNNVNAMYNNPQITQPIDDYWENVMSDFSEWAVGTDADWGTYWERGLGKSNINLALQFHADLATNNPYIPDAIEDYFNDGIDYNKVFSAEPDDTGALERAFETLVGIAADFPSFALGGLAGVKGGPFGVAFGAGFVNDAIKEMYIQALESDTPPDSFGDWWTLFSHHGISAGVEGGISMMSLVGGQKIAASTIGKIPGVNKFISDFVGRFAGLTASGAYLNGELPSKDELVNNAIVLSTIGSLEGIGRSGKNYISKENLKMFNDSAKLNKMTFKERLNELLKDKQSFKELYSINKKKFAADRKANKEEAQFIKEQIEILRQQEKKVAEEISKDQGRNIQNLEQYVNAVTKSGKVNKETAVKIVEYIKETNSVVIKDLVSTFKLTKKQANEVVNQLESNGFIGRSKILGTYQVITFEAQNLYKETQKAKKLALDKEIISLKQKEQTPEVQARLKFLKKELAATNKVIRRETDNVSLGNRINILKKRYFDLTGKKIDPPKVKRESEPSSKDGFSNLTEKPVVKNFAANFIDNKQPVKVIVEKIAKESNKKLTNNEPLTPYELLRLQPGMIGKAFQFLEVGVLKFENKAGQTYIGKPFKEIIERFSTNRELEIANQYLIAKQAIGIYNQYKGTPAEKTKHAFEVTGIKVSRAREFIKQNREKYEVFAKEVAQYQKGLIDYLYESGTIPKDLYIQFKRSIEKENYVPLKRKIDAKEFSGETGSSTSPGFSGSLLRRKGSTKEILPPLDSIYANTLSFISMAERNAALAYFFREVKKFEKEFPGVRLPYDILPASKNPQIRTKKIELTTKEKEKFELPLEESFSVFRKDGHLKQNEGQLQGGNVKFYENGKLKEFYIPDYTLFNSFKDLSFTRVEGFLFPIESIMKYTRLPTKTLRAGITLDPRFMLANGIRDTFAAALYSKNKFIVGLDSVRGMRSYLKRKQPGKHKDMYEAYVRSGGNQSQLLSIDRNYFQNMEANAYLKHKVKSYNNVIDFAKQPNLEFLRKMSDVFESGSRLRNYELSMNRLRKENAKLPENKRMTERQMEQRAGFEARDITIDFRKMGTAVKLINQQSAFYNANIQGLTKLYEAGKDPKTAPYFMRNALLYITMPSLLLHSVNYDSKVYESLSQFEKDMFWILIFNEDNEDETMIYRIPKPFELGIIFGSIPERMMSWALSGDSGTTFKKEAKKFYDNLLKTVLPDFNAIKPIVEININKNLSLDTPIVPSRLEKISPEHRYNYGTTAVSKVVIKSLHNALDFIGLDEFSSMDLDYLWKNWTGQLGTYAFEGISVILEGAEIDKKMQVDLVRPKSDNFYRRLQEFPVIGKFMSSFPTANTSYINNFYEEWKKWEQEENTNKIYFKSDKTDVIRERVTSEKGIKHLQMSYMISFNEIFQESFQVLNMMERIDSIPPEVKYDIQEIIFKQMLMVGRTWQELHNNFQDTNNVNEKKSIINKYSAYVTSSPDGKSSVLQDIRGVKESILNKLDPEHRQKLEKESVQKADKSTFFGFDLPYRQPKQGFY